ncbi:MAG: PCRF domain-containing protein, partial [Burkholderiaceae bacterium]
MKASLIGRLERMRARLEEVNAVLASAATARDRDALRALHREHAELSEVLEHWTRLRQAEQDLETAGQMLDDPQMQAFAEEEQVTAHARVSAEETVIERLLLPRDPHDARDAILEIRAGTGGDESALFAGDLLRMYLRYAERRGWRTELLSQSESELGGYREVITRIEGDGVFGRLKFESGAHRVQRVPQTEAQGRIHTSACTVAVLADADEVGGVGVAPAGVGGVVVGGCRPGRPPPHPNA